MPHMLKEALANYLTPSELDKIFSAFDVIGDIVIIKIPNCLMSKKEIIGEAILGNVKPAKSVFIQTSAIKVKSVLVAPNGVMTPKVHDVRRNLL